MNVDVRAKPNPSFAPMYCALYPELVKLARAHGYALAVHGSLQRDMDLICVPWTETPSDPEVVVDAITARFHIVRVGGQPTQKNHGRLAYTISVGFGECSIDLSFMPVSSKPPFGSVVPDLMRQVCEEWLQMHTELPGVEKFERFTYVPEVEELRDLMAKLSGKAA